MSSSSSSLPPFSLPVPAPHASSVPLPPRELTPSQTAALDSLVAHFNSPSFRPPTTVKALRAIWKKSAPPVGVARSALGGLGNLLRRSAGGSVDDESEVPVFREMDDVEKCYWSREAFHRALRATKWDEEAAVKRCELTLVWRREYGVEEMRPEQVEEEGATGKEIVFGFDRNCRPVLYMHPWRQNTVTTDRQVEFVVWCLERAIDLCPPSIHPVDSLCLVIDFGASRGEGSSQPTSISQARKVLDILQNYYFERLGRALCMDVPGIFAAFYAVVAPFVDPLTKEKIKLEYGPPDATPYIPPEQLQSLLGGAVNFDYDHEAYFPALTKLTDEIKAANLARWRQYGNGKCGLSEAVIRGAVVPGAETSATPEVGETEMGKAKDESNTSTLVDANEELEKVVESLVVQEQEADGRKEENGVLGGFESRREEIKKMEGKEQDDIAWQKATVEHGMGITPVGISSGII